MYELKKNQIEQKLIEKASINHKILQIENEIKDTQIRINTISVDKLGAISDFVILAMHKDSLRFHIKNLTLDKNNLEKKSEELLEEIVELQKESEKYKYILEEDKLKKNKDFLDSQVLESEEFIQSKYIRL